jgi:hypothetical protein
LICVAIGGLVYLWSTILESEKERIENQYKEWFRIPSNGEGELTLFLKKSLPRTFKTSNESAFGNLTDSYQGREDVYLVFNYHPEDSMFMFRYIDSLAIDTAIHWHELEFYLYSNHLPYNKCRYWKLEYCKLQFDTLYTIDTKEAIPHMLNKHLRFIRFPEFDNEYRHNRREHYEFVYDEKKKHFRPVKEQKKYYFKKKDGTFYEYPVIFYE